MKSLKDKLILRFAKDEADEVKESLTNESTNSNQPNTSSSSSNNNSKKDEPSKKLSKKTKKRLIFWSIVILLIGGILAIALYFNLRQTEQYIDNSDIQTIQTTDGQKGRVVLNNGISYAFDVQNGSAWSYRYSTDSFKVYLSVPKDLPITFRVNAIQNPQTGNWTFNINSDLQISQTNQNQYNLLYGATSNWTSPPEPFNWLALISVLMPIVFFILLGFMIYKAMRMQSGMDGSGILGMGKSNAEVAKSDVKFCDVAGIQEEKQELSELVDYLKHPQKYVEMGAQLPRGVILYGPPGTGKTLLAKAVAGEANVPFIQTSGSQFEEMFVGLGAKRIRDLFAKARKVAPSIIFIDEIDAVASKRGINGSLNGSADQTINQLLSEMDGFNTTSGIIVIAATNRLDVLDEAILRPGRFDRHIQVNLPDIKEREEILKIHARNKNISKKVSFYDIARRTPGFSGAQLANVLNEATLLAVRNNQKTINLVDIDEAIDRVIAGPAKKSRVIAPEERKLVAYHEAGHALVGLYTPGTDVVQKITIIPRGAAGGYTMQTPEGTEKHIQSKQDLLDDIRMTLGGRAAEEVVFGPDKITTGASNDLYKVTNVARAMVMQLGMSSSGMTQFVPSEGSANPYQQQKLYSDDKAREIDASVEKIIETEFKAAKAIIKKNRQELELIVETLLILETILKDDIDYIHKHKKLPKAALEMKAKLKAAKKESTEELKQETTKNNKAKKAKKD